MRSASWMHATGVTVLALACGAALAQTATQRVDMGQREYENNCAACHGRDGKGLGPYAEWLKRAPPDLTTMSRSNGGVFPLVRAQTVIEGAGPGHGSRDMPIWGREYSIRAGEYYADMPYDTQPFVRARILALVEYLNRIQVK